MENERRHRVGKERIKYRTRDGEPDSDKIRVTTKAIARECFNVTVRFDILQNGTTLFIVSGPDEGKELALQLIHQRLKGRPPPDPPPTEFQLNAENLRRHNESITERRQFACRACPNVWWRKVFAYKPVSRCCRCNVRYDPIPKIQEFGWGHYRCPRCGNVFTGQARAGVEAPCFACGHQCLPDRIGPKPTRDPPQQARQRHACEACANGRIRPCPTFSELPVASEPHDSTGSTVSTFLTQQSETEIDFDED